MTRIIASSAEARSLIGESLGPSEGVLIDQARIDAFADATNDHQWIHVDVDRALLGAFGSTIAHGYLTLALIPHFSSAICKFAFGSARLNYGANKVRFPSPVKAGSLLSATASITEVRPDEQGTFITVRYTIAANDAVKPACVAETITLVIGEKT